MKKSLALGLLSLMCNYALAQTAPTPAAPAPATPTAATQAAPSAAPAATSGVVGGKNATYTDSIPPEQIIALDANGDTFQARHIGDLSGLPRGAVIVLHDSGQHPNWPFTAAALIDDLPLHGWNTLAIELPTPAAESRKAAEPPANTTPTPAPAANAAPPSTPPATTATPAASPTTTAPALDIEPQAQARINAAIKYFTDQNQRTIVLIGFGSGAIRAAENLRLIAAVNPADANTATTPTATTPPPTTPASTAPLSALVMIAPLQKVNGIEMDLPKLLPLTGIPALDLILDNDPQARAEAEARRRAVLHQRARIYTRLELAPINTASDAQHSAMVKRVRSWLQAKVSPATNAN